MSNNSEYYDILEVKKTATSEEIQKAYKRQSLKWHPDRHKTDKAKATERFQSIAEAYQILNDKEKRKIYDMYGKDVAQGHATSEMNGETGSGMSGMHGMSGMSGMPRNVKFNFPGMMDPNELFKNMFAEDDISSRFSQTTRMCGNTTSFQFSMGNVGTRSNMSKTRPILEKDVILTLKELAIGTVKKMKLSATTINGEPFTKIFTINVKPGWKEGTNITFSCSKYGGDIRFKVIEKPHSYLKRNGNNLYWNYIFPPEKINKGLRIELRTPFPDEVVKIETPKNQLYDGMKMVIDGKGMSIKGDVNNRGNLVIRFASATL